MSETRIAKSLDVLRRQVDALAPDRDTSSDGWIAGDKHHKANPKSDHEPDKDGVVKALDITHDPKHGVNSHVLAQQLIDSHDPRIKYIIDNRTITSGTGQGHDPWVRRPYYGSNPHDAHVHVSVKKGRPLYDSTDEWDISSQLGPLPPSAAFSGKGSWFSQHRGKYWWIDRGDKPNSNALGVPDNEQGIALPDKSTLGEWFNVTAPNGKTLRLQQTDIGPNPRTGRKIDIAAVAAERFGYSPNYFPTDGNFIWTPVKEEAA